MTSSAEALNESTPVEQGYGVDNAESSLITSEGKWAKKYAVEMLKQYPDLQTNPYAILARFDESATNQQITDLLGEIDANIVDYFANSDLYLVETVAGNVNARNFLYGSPLVKFVDFDGTVSAENLTNDPRIGELWGLTGSHGIGASAAWQNTSGANEVVVAVIDSGVDVSHPDLANVIWENSNEIAGNGIDDDGNGYVDDLNGWDFINNDNQPEDGNGHGTHVSGTIAAVRNNGLGVAGVANNVKIMPLRFLDSAGKGYLSNAISALNYAISNGAPISNNSWGGGGYSQSLHTAIGAANEAGHTFVAAAGNSGLNIDAVATYPAAYDNDNVISVAAIDSSGNLASFSNYGPNNVDIASPGVSIVSTVSHQYCGQSSGADCYASFDGTSMAAPHVTGVVALILGMRPGSTPQEISQILRDSARTSSGLYGAVSFGAELDAAAAVTLASSTGSISFPDHTQGETIFQNDIISVTAFAVQSDGTDVSAAVNWKDISGNSLGTGATLTYGASVLGELRLMAEVEDSTGITLRNVATFAITEGPVFEFTSPLHPVEPESGEIFQADWTWEGPSEETANLLLQSISSYDIEGTYAMPDIKNKPDLSEFTFAVEGTGDVDDLLLGIRLDHTYLADLNISLVHPDGTEVLLAKRDGGFNDNYGNGDASCAGNLSYFTDNAAESISDRSPPYVGGVRPREQLSAFDGKPKAGNWTLRILDDWDQDQGTFYCAKLLLATTDSQTITLSNDEQLSTGSYDWQIPNPIMANIAGTYRIGFTDTSLGDSWGCCVFLQQSPDAPTNIVATPGDGQVAVSFVAPSSIGSSTITSYTVTASPGGQSCTGGGACMVTGLTNGTVYTFTVVATNSVGDSVPSVASNAVTP
ncbi:MAG: S8 family serine peptidase [Acidimicrobiales bacterium]|nr:S8 family serine peptidase [Acidimicrobiales bacterium]